MKITISYTDAEEREARLIQQFASALLGGVKVKKTERHPPFKHVFMASKMPPKS